MILRLVRLAATVLVLTFVAVVVWTTTWPIRTAEEAPVVDAILCLGGGVMMDGSLAEETRRRAETCAALYLAGKAPVIVMSAGPAQGGGLGAGAEAMAEAAVAAGIPAAAVLREDRSYSTLQNVLFSRDLLPDVTSVIVVTEAFHLPRSKASAHWSGFDEVHMLASERIGDRAGLAARARIILRESLAIWFNLARASIYSAAGLAGLPDQDRIDWLH